MIKNLGHAYRRPFVDTENEEEREEGLENCREGNQIDSKVLQQYMANQAQMIATASKKTGKGN